MSVADKLTTIAENQQKVYDAGFTAGQAQGGGGGDSYYDQFWDMYQQNGQRTNYSNGFAYGTWNDEVFQPKYPLQPTNASNMFYRTTGLTEITNVDLSKATDVSFAFYMCDNLVRIGKCDFSSAQGGLMTPPEACQTFAQNFRLKTIDEIVSKEDLVWDSTFMGLTALESVTFSGTIGTSIDFSSCHQLTIESIESIIDCLKDLNGQTAQTLKLSSSVSPKLDITEHLLKVHSLNWTLVY